MTKVEKLQKFMNDNGLSFDGSGSGLNSNCCILAGYACAIDASFIDITSVIYNTEAIAEMKKVFEFAQKNNYSEWWKTDRAKSIYKFEL